MKYISQSAHRHIVLTYELVRVARFLRATENLYRLAWSLVSARVGPNKKRRRDLRNALSGKQPKRKYIS